MRVFAHDKNNFKGMKSTLMLTTSIWILQSFRHYMDGENCKNLLWAGSNVNLGKERNLQIFERLAQTELVALLPQLSIQTVICCDASLRMHLKLQRLFFFLHNVVLFPDAEGYAITVPYPHPWSRNNSIPDDP